MFGSEIVVRLLRPCCAGGLSQRLFRPACSVNNVLDCLPTSLAFCVSLHGMADTFFKKGEPHHHHHPSPETLNFERKDMC